MSQETRRIPPNQRVASKFPVLHEGPIPKFDPKTWDFVVEGLVKNPVRLTYEEFLRLPKVVNVSDFHCVTGWSKLDNNACMQHGGPLRLVVPKNMPTKAQSG